MAKGNSTTSQGLEYALRSVSKCETCAHLAILAMRERDDATVVITGPLTSELASARAVLQTALSEIAARTAGSLSIDDLPRLTDEEREAAESGYVAMQGVLVGQEPDTNWRPYPNWRSAGPASLPDAVGNVLYAHQNRLRQIQGIIACAFAHAEGDPEDNSHSRHALEVALELSCVRMMAVILRQDDKALLERVIGDANTYSDAADWFQREASYLRKASTLFDTAVSRLATALGRQRDRASEQVAN